MQSAGLLYQGTMCDVLILVFCRPERHRSCSTEPPLPAPCLQPHFLTFPCITLAFSFSTTFFCDRYFLLSQRKKKEKSQSSEVPKEGHSFTGLHSAYGTVKGISMCKLHGADMAWTGLNWSGLRTNSYINRKLH